MPRAPRADEAGGLYHALNRGKLRADIFRKEADFDAFERILQGGLEIHQIELFSDQLMSSHYHLVLRQLVDGEMSRFMGWIGGTHTMRYHAHYHTSGLGHVYQQRSSGLKRCENKFRLRLRMFRPFLTLGHPGFFRCFRSVVTSESLS